MYLEVAVHRTTAALVPSTANYLMTPCHQPTTNHLPPTATHRRQTTFRACARRRMRTGCWSRVEGQTWPLDHTPMSGAVVAPPHGLLLHPRAVGDLYRILTVSTPTSPPTGSSAQHCDELCVCLSVYSLISKITKFTLFTSITSS